MPEFRLKRSTSLLIGIGLVLVGLLTGILGMLYYGGGGASEVAPRIVERVELGRSLDQQVPAAHTDSTLPAAEVTDLSRLNGLFKEVASSVTPSVVYIQVRTGEALPEDAERQPFFRHPRQSVGSGVVISENGHIVTNKHVIENAETIQVTLPDKRRFEGRLVGMDSSTDLAIIQIDGDVTPVAFGNSDDVEVGEWVIAVGNPFRLTSTVTAGIVSALGRQVDIIEDEFRIEDFIQTDAAINPGNSGGALVNLQGELVGIATAIATESGSYEGYGFAVPVNLMERVAHDLIAYGEVRRGYLGVTIKDIDADVARHIGLDRIDGVYVENVRDGAAAERAGLRSGDVVLAVEGQRVNAANELQSVVARHAPGEHISLNVWRDGTSRRLIVELDGRDESWLDQLTENRQPSIEEHREERDSKLFELEPWGLGLRALTGNEREIFGTAEGVYLAYVRKGSVAERAGLPRDVALTQVDGQIVTSVKEATRALRQAAETSDVVLLRVERRDGVSEFYEAETP